MLYSKEIIDVDGIKREVSTYLKNTRNHSWRITAKKIIVSLPQVYKSPETIALHRAEMLKQVILKLKSNPHLLYKTELLTKDSFQYLGDRYRIFQDESIAKHSIDFKAKCIELPEIVDDKLKAKILKKLMNQYSEAVNIRVRYINQISVQKKIISVTVKNNQSTWGLCSSRGEITISANLLFAPLWVIDYVIVHELCHLIHHNHSDKFWSLVEIHFPKYKLAKNYLKTNGVNLSL